MRSFLHRTKTAVALSSLTLSIEHCAKLQRLVVSNRVVSFGKDSISVESKSILKQRSRSVNALFKWFDVVRLFIQEFKWNINQENIYGVTPLCRAAENVEMARFLLENGANVNHGGEFGPLSGAVGTNNAELVRFLLVEYQANPNLNRRPVEFEDTIRRGYLRITDSAIRNGNAAILRMLLERGAFVGHINLAHVETSLNVLLCDRLPSGDTKRTIASMLVEHAKEGNATAAFCKLRSSLQSWLWTMMVARFSLKLALNQVRPRYIAHFILKFEQKILPSVNCW
jgi:Ankyrin repeats (3 copies)